MDKKSGHMIKCLLTELGRAVRENIWLSFICTDLAALGPYGMTSSQIFSRTALPLSQQVHIILAMSFSFVIPEEK